MILGIRWQPVLVLILLTGSCTGPFERARRKDTAQAYRYFVSHHPDHPQVAEARRLEAEAAFRELSDDPGIKELRFYVDRYPESPRAEDARTRLIEMRLEQAIEDRNLYGLKKLLRDAPDESLEKRIREAFAYLSESRKALLRLDRSHFERYLAKHQGGEFAKHARSALEWLDGLKEHPQRRIAVVLDISSVARAKSQIAHRLKSVRAIPEFRRRMGDLSKLDGKLVYRVTEVTRGDMRQLYNYKGELVDVTMPGSGVIVEILKVKDGKVQPLWQWGTPKLLGLEALDIPAISWDTRAAVIAEQKSDTTMGAIADFGRYLLVSTLDGFSLYDPSSPDKIRPVFHYARPQGVVRKSDNVLFHTAVSGKLVALYGDGVELLDCHSLGDIRRNVAADFSSVGEVTHGAFIGDRFFFVTKDGSLYKLDMDSRYPAQVGYGTYNMVAAMKNELVAGTEDGLVFYEVDAKGNLGSRSALQYNGFPETFNSASPIVSSRLSRDGLLMVNGRGEIALIRDDDFDARYVNSEDVGKILEMDTDRRWLASIGDGGLALRLHLRQDGRWYYFGAVPAFHCQGVDLRYPMAYLICGDSLYAVHMGALVKNQ